MTPGTTAERGSAYRHRRVPFFARSSRGDARAGRRAPLFDPVWSSNDVFLCLAKYGLIDRQCEVDARHAEGGLRGVAALRANGFVAGANATTEDRKFAAGCMDDLAQEMGPCVLKLFLQDQLPDNPRMAHFMETYTKGQPELLPGYWPRGFVVTDACITNAPSIWSEKHFYS